MFESLSEKSKDRAKKRKNLNEFLDTINMMTMQSLIFDKDPDASEMVINLGYMTRKEVLLTRETQKMVEEITPDLIFARAEKAIATLKDLLYYAPVDFTMPQQDTLELHEILKENTNSSSVQKYIKSQNRR